MVCVEILWLWIFFNAKVKVAVKNQTIGHLFSKIKLTLTRFFWIIPHEKSHRRRPWFFFAKLNVMTANICGHVYAADGKSQELNIWSLFLSRLGINPFAANGKKNFFRIYLKTRRIASENWLRKILPFTLIYGSKSSWCKHLAISSYSLGVVRKH